MGLIKSDLKFTESYSNTLNNKIQELGTGEIEEGVESNIIGVEENKSTFYEALNIMQEYKIQLEADLTRVKNVGTAFFDIDNNLLKN